MNDVIKIPLTSHMDISKYESYGQLYCFSLGPNNEICLLFAKHTQECKKKIMYTAILVGDDWEQIIEVSVENTHFHYLQPIGADSILLVNARCWHYDDEGCDKNASIFDASGSFVRSFTLGDGIQSVQVTQESFIWTSYFDEGVFGNNGWNDPIGKSGLRSWSVYGEPLYDYDDTEHFIADCYALNVVSNNTVWFYYYTDFLLGKYHNGKLEFFENNVNGSSGFCVYSDLVLFQGGYNYNKHFLLFQLRPNNTMVQVGTIQFLTESNEVLLPIFDARKSTLLFLEDNLLYRVQLEEWYPFLSQQIYLSKQPLKRILNVK